MLETSTNSTFSDMCSRKKDVLGVPILDRVRSTGLLHHANTACYCDTRISLNYVLVHISLFMNLQYHAE